MKKTIKKDKKTATKNADKTKNPLIVENTLVTITVPKKDADKAYSKAVKKLAKKLKIDGFRKGKVPAKIAEESLNPEQIIEEALQAVVPDIYYQEIKKLGLKPLTQPEFNPISLKKGEEWTLEAHVAEKQDINLKSYKKIVKKAAKKALKEVEKVDKQAKILEKDAKKNKSEYKKPSTEEKNNFVLQSIYKELAAELKPKVQELLVRNEVRHDLDSLNHRLKDMNITFEKFLEHRKMSFEQLTNELGIGALSRLQMAFLINEIAQTEKILVNKEDLDAEFAKVKDEELKKQQMSDPRYLDIISQNILRQKVADYLLSVK